MPTKEVKAIELPKLKIQEMEISLIGDTPLIVHSWSPKAKKEMLDKQMKKAGAGQKKAKDPYKDFMESLYVLDDGTCGFPSVGFKAAAVTACTSVGGITKVAARQAFHVVGEHTIVHGAFEGVKMRQDLVMIQGFPPEMREDMVRIAMGTADLRYRGEYWPWLVTVKVRYNTNVLSEEQIVNLFNTAGFGVGVGEWRAERDGQHGLFHVATAEELKKMPRSHKQPAKTPNPRANVVRAGRRKVLDKAA